MVAHGKSLFGAGVNELSCSSSRSSTGRHFSIPGTKSNRVAPAARRRRERESGSYFMAGGAHDGQSSRRGYTASPIRSDQPPTATH